LIDAVVADVEMPGDTSAVNVARWIEVHRPELASRIVFTSSQPSDRLAGEIRNSGCRILTKPFPIEKLSEAVHAVLTAPVPSASNS